MRYENEIADLKRRRRDFYIYEALATAIPIGTSATDDIAIEADSDFWLQKLTYEADLGGVAQTDAGRIIPNVSLQITDTSSGRQLMQDPIPIPSLFGYGALPFILPHPRKFRANGVIQVAFTSFELAVTPTIRLAFIGYKVYGLQ